MAERQLALFADGGDPGPVEEPVSVPAAPDAAVGQQALWPAPERLADLVRRAAACRRCILRRGCRGVVFGEGDPAARLVLVGEGPGKVEDELGRPFVGPAGQLLDRILAAAGFCREEVYITNVVMCRPPDNRVPRPDEVAACLPWLLEKLALIGPRIVLCLGALAAKTLLDPGLSITRARGHWQERDGVLFLATFHPAALLRDADKKRPVWEDFRQVQARYKTLAGDRPGEVP